VIYIAVVAVVVVVEGSLVPFMHETGPEGYYRITLSIIKLRAKKVRFESAFKRVQTVRVINCGQQTVPHDWPGHRESSVVKFRPRTWNRVVGASR